MAYFRCGGKPEQEKSVTPSAKAQTILPDSGKTLKKVTVTGDPDLAPANIKQGVNIFGVDGELLDELVTIDGVKVKEKLDLIKIVESSKLADLPYSFRWGSAVVYNGEIHIMGGADFYDSNAYKKHYKLNGTTWSSVGTLPFNFYIGQAVVYNNEIHIISSFMGSYGKSHYKFNGSSWTNAGSLPYEQLGPSAVIFNNEIHVLGNNSRDTSQTKRHYKFNGSSWTSASTLPYTFYDGQAVVYNNEIHIIGGYKSTTSHYKWDGSSWTQVSTLPIQVSGCPAIVYKNEIHIFNDTYHYKWDGVSWIQCDELPYSSYYSCLVLYNQTLNLLGGDCSSGDKGVSFNHYKIFEESYKEA